MKKYNWTVSVFAETFRATTNNGDSSGFYSFYDGKTIVACYPIEKTIITGIEDLEEE